MSDSLPLLLFAKAPIAGQVKTRLTSDCSNQQAAEIAMLLMEASIQRACDCWPGSVYLSVWLDSNHPFFDEMQQRYPIQMAQQCEGDLGEKMRHALATFGYPSAVMGCDAPHVEGATLKFAHQSLLNGKSVIGPSDDGGYYLLGLCQTADTLFENKPWGSQEVLANTLASADAMGLDLLVLPSLNDVDEWPDLIQVAGLVPSLLTYLSTQALY